MENQTLEQENLSPAPGNGHAEVLEHYSDAVGMKAYERDAGGLRNLESDLQQGLGAAHGLLAIFELTRKPS